MKRSIFLWFAFLLCLAVVLGAMAWVSAEAVRLDRAEARARRQAKLEENVRLALWRMDSALAPLVAQENARPYFAYRTFLPVNQAYGRMFNRKGGEALTPSPLLSEPALFVQVYFQFEPDGKLTSPRLPLDRNYDLAVPHYLSEETVQRAKAELARVEKLTDRGRLVEKLPKCEPAPLEVVMAPMNQSPANLAMTNQAPGLPPYLGNERLPQQRRQAPAQQNRQPDQQEAQQQIAADFEQRSQALAINAAAMVQQQKANEWNNPLLGATDVRGMPMTALWIGEELLLARRVVVGGQEYVQGCLLDWPTIRASLLENAADLLPEASLEPVAEMEGEPSRMLAALPARLVPGSVSLDDDGAPSPIRLILWAAWAGVVLAAGAVAALLAGVVRLSERRAAFVSAVTHELRTPLTTFHMYTEMLTEGMVTDPAQQQAYLSTLRAEAARLSHLVENVLAYARLERGRANGRIEDVTVRRLIEPICRRLADRAAQAGMELCVEGDDETMEAVVRANPSAVEQILFNLVDNACKYAAAATDRRIHLSAGRRDGAVRLCVRDHGPGIQRPAARRLFRPFSKSAHEAANTAPGIGLGLALSRRLARDMGARLQLDRAAGEGAALVLTLPAARSRPTKGDCSSRIGSG